MFEARFPMAWEVVVGLVRPRQGLVVLVRVPFIFA
jgi:hypothetical protein